MKRFDLMFMLTCLSGMVVSLVGLFMFQNPDQVFLLVMLFISFGFGGTVVMLKQKGLLG